MTARALVAVYRNLNRGKAWNAHAWSIAHSTPKRDASYGKKIRDAKAGELLLLENVTACYSPSATAAVRSSGTRSVFAWFRGTLRATPYESAYAYRKGRRLGLRPDKGEFRFCYADTREPCPRTFRAIFFTLEGAFEALPLS